MAAEDSPDLILCDLAMPGARPVEGVRRLIDAAPDAKLVVVTGSEDDRVLFELFELGVDGFAPKSLTGEVLDAAIRLVLAGGRYLPQRVYDIAADAAPRPRAEPDGVAILSERKREVLQAMAQGLSNKQIAIALDLSPTTVKSHAAAIIAALGARNRTEAAARAREQGLI